MRKNIIKKVIGMFFVLVIGLFLTSTHLSAQADQPYRLQSALASELDIVKNSNYGISVLLKKNGEVVSNQSNLTYTWQVENPALLTVSPFAACLEGVAPPCPEGNASIKTSDAFGSTKVRIKVMDKTSGAVIARKGFVINVIEKPNPAAYQQLELGNSLTNALTKSDNDNVMSARGKADYYKIQVPQDAGQTGRVEVKFTSLCQKSNPDCKFSEKFVERMYVFDAELKPVTPQYEYDTRVEFDLVKNQGKTFYIVAGSDGNYVHKLGGYQIVFQKAQ